MRGQKMRGGTEERNRGGKRRERERRRQRGEYRVRFRERERGAYSAKQQSLRLASASVT